MVYIHHYRHDFVQIVPAIYSAFLFSGEFVQYVNLIWHRDDLIAFVTELSDYTAERE